MPKSISISKTIALLAIAIAYDDQPDPVFPPWVARFNVVVAIALVPAGFAGLTRSGPFAWDGILSFWLRNFAITMWLVVMWIELRRAMDRDHTAVKVPA